MASKPADESIAVGDVMHTGVVTCAPDASLREAAALLAAHGIHAVVVVSSDEVPPEAS